MQAGGNLRCLLRVTDHVDDLRGLGKSKRKWLSEGGARLRKKARRLYACT